MTPTTEPDNLDCAGGGTTCNNYTTVNTGDADAQNQDFGFYAEMDCGDLPNTYNSLSTNYYTWLSKEGPCHIMGNHRLGTLWDAEPDGIPDDDAGRTGGGDDGDASDDEDGIIPVDLTSWTGGSTVEITMTAVEGSNAYLVGWFDWNDDRDFIDTTNGGYDTGEYVFFGQVASTTTATRLDVQIPDPCAACAGMVLNARFRLYEGHSPPPIIAPTGIVRNGEVEDYQWDWNPTAVRLVSLSAMGQVSHIRVMWETATEVDNVGFYLYRRPAGRGDYAPLNDGLLIPSQSPGSGAGASYVFIDEEVELGVTYEYLLEDVDLDGVRTAHGPVMASLAPYSIFLPLVHK